MLLNGRHGSNAEGTRQDCVVSKDSKTLHHQHFSLKHAWVQIPVSHSLLMMAELGRHFFLLGLLQKLRDMTHSKDPILSPALSLLSLQMKAPVLAGALSRKLFGKVLSYKHINNYKRDSNT